MQEQSVSVVCILCRIMRSMHISTDFENPQQLESMRTTRRKETRSFEVTTTSFGVRRYCDAVDFCI